jgi:hypothetical protein
VQRIRRRIGVVRAHVGQHDMLSDANPPRDRLTYLTGPDNDDYVLHDCPLTALSVSPVYEPDVPAQQQISSDGVPAAPA